MGGPTKKPATVAEPVSGERTRGKQKKRAEVLPGTCTRAVTRAVALPPGAADPGGFPLPPLAMLVWLLGVVGAVCFGLGLVVGLLVG